MKEKGRIWNDLILTIPSNILQTYGVITQKKTHGRSLSETRAYNYSSMIIEQVKMIRIYHQQKKTYFQSWLIIDREWRYRYWMKFWLERTEN